jgi:hypothetical protein
LTLRGDFFGQALSDRSFADRLQDGQVNLGPMTSEELERSITEPAEKAGVNFEHGLVDRILDDVGQEPGNLPLLAKEGASARRRGRNHHRRKNTSPAERRADSHASAAAARAEGVATLQNDPDHDSVLKLTGLRHNFRAVMAMARRWELCSRKTALIARTRERASLSRRSPLAISKARHTPSSSINRGTSADA